MNVVFVSDHFTTPEEPGILRTWQLCKTLADAGDRVTVIAPRTHYLFGDRGGERDASVTPTGVQLVRIKTSPVTRGRTGSRLRYYAEQLVGGTVEAFKAGRVDVIVAGLTPSLLGVGPYLVARARRIPFVLDERDLALDAVDEWQMVPPSVLAIARSAEQFLHRHADAVIAVTPTLRRWLHARGVDPSRLHLVPNGYEGLDEREVGVDARSIRTRFGWNDRTVVLYSGGLGRVYDLDTVLDAFHRLPRDRFLLVVMGEGELKAHYRERAEREGLPVQFLRPRPKREVAPVCAAADIGIIPLPPLRWAECSLSNKLFDYLGAGTPVVVTGPGDTADVVRAADAGKVVAAGDAEAFAAALAGLASDPEALVRRGLAAREFIAREWDRRRFVLEFRNILTAVAANRNGSKTARRRRELVRIRTVYRRYDADARERKKRDPDNPGTRRIIEERRLALANALVPPRTPHPRILDVGCGNGSDLEWFAGLFERPKLYGIDVLPDRIENARRRVPHAKLCLGSGDTLPYQDRSFHIVLASLLFSSVLDRVIAASIAEEMTRVLHPDGVIVTYDLRYPNPTNPNVRPLSRLTLRTLFPMARIRVRSITVLPPLARRLGRFTAAGYPLLGRIPALRGHYVAEISPHSQQSASSVAPPGTVDGEC